MYRSAGTLVLIAGVVAACAPTPSSSPGLAAAPASSPSATELPTPSASQAAPPIPASLSAATSTPAFGGGGWPVRAVSEPTFGPDGTVYVLVDTWHTEEADQQSLVALDAGGYTKLGWPIEGRPGYDFGSLAVGPDGSAYVEECGASNVGCVLHRFGIDGLELPGWPFEVPPASTCSTSADCGLVVGSDGTAYLTSGYQTGYETQIVMINAAGTIERGWPVALDRRNWSWSDPELSSDGSVFILSRFNGSESSTAISLSAFAPDGSPRPGWPVSVPGMVGYLLGPEGTVVVWSLIDYVREGCPRPRSTVFTVLGPDGRTLSGWPRRSTGLASSPAVGGDGTVYYVSALGDVYALDRAGEIKAGWPVPVPGALVTSACGPAKPYMAPDGTTYVLGDEVTALSPDGSSRPRWPYSPAGSLYSPTTEGYAGALRPAPAFGPDGTVYVAVFGRREAKDVTDVVALDRQGQLKPGWPYPLPIDVSPNGNGALSLAVRPDGRLSIDVVDCCAPGRTLMALDPDGRISH